MPYILKNNKIDKRYEEKFFEIIRDNLPDDKIRLFNNLLSRKTEIVREFLSDVQNEKLGKSEFDKILSLIFSVRRHREKIIDTVDVGSLSKGFICLSDFKKSTEIRLGRFLESFIYENIIVKRDIAMEVLHFYEPDKNVLWTSWVYRQDNGTGCLPYMADFLKRTWDGNPYIMPFSIMEMRDEVDYLYELSNKNGFAVEPPYGVDILLSYMYSDYVYKMVYAESKSLSIGVPEGFTLMKKLLGVEKLELFETEAVG
ncbi:hypothetical protein ACMCNP_07940 [Candidatus Acidulodesulfobacterium sp. H_13]|uniref:hypothetical protein n=1 Tax=Candidatus Acidulodesulfobacterium sp. H_13 TaxID=3395470 RepID=UPI003AF9FA28